MALVLYVIEVYQEECVAVHVAVLTDIGPRFVAVDVAVRVALPLRLLAALCICRRGCVNAPGPRVAAPCRSCRVGGRSVRSFPLGRPHGRRSLVLRVAPSSFSFRARARAPCADGQRVVGPRG